MQLENIPEFAGTQEDSTQPTDFIKMIKRQFIASGTTAESQKMGLFELYLKSDSPAEDWYIDAKGKKDWKTWDALEQDFKDRFPNIKKATKTAPELERELRAMRIKTEELGKMEKYRGEEDELPEVLREKIPENQASWSKFAQAIKDVDMGHIREGVRKHREKAANEAQMKADINLLKQRTAGDEQRLILTSERLYFTDFSHRCVGKIT
jgi:hypothetical protein